MKTLLARFKQKDSLTYAIYKLYKTNALSTVLSLFSVLLIIRHVPRSEYGLYQVTVAAVGFGGLFLGGFDQSIMRYWQSDIDSNDKMNILQVVLLFKSTITVVAITGVLIFLFSGMLSGFLGLHSEVNYFPYVVVALASLALSSLSSTVRSLFNAQLMYDYVFKVSAIQASAILVLTALMVWFDSNYISILIVNLLVVFTVSAWNTRYIFMSSDISLPSLLSFQKPDILYAFHNYVKPYSLPLTMGSVLTYVKNQLPIILIGGFAGLEVTANYSILRNLLRTIHKQYGSYLGPLLSKLVKMKEENIIEFVRKYNILAFTSIGGRIVISGSILLFIGPLFQLLKIGNPQLNVIIVQLLLLEFVIADISLFNATIISLGRSTIPLLKSGMSRCVVESLLTYLLTVRYGPIGAAVTLLISRTVDSWVSVYYASKENILRFQNVILALLVVFYSFYIYWNRSMFIVML